MQRNGQPLAIISASETLAAVDATSGKILWQVVDLKGNTAPSPSVAGELVVVASSNPGFTRAYRLEQGRGGEEIAPVWTADKVTTSYGSPLVYRGYVYQVNKAGVATCVELQSGETQWSERLPGVCWATPLAAGDCIYFFSKDGTTTVYEAGPAVKKVAENELSITDDVYGVAAVENSILIRSGRGLVRVTTEPAADSESPPAYP